MESVREKIKTKRLGALLLVVMALAFFSIAAVFLSQDTLCCPSDKDPCKSAINARMFTLTHTDNETMEIPATCFKEGEPTIDELSGAEPGDHLEIVENPREMTEEDYKIVKKEG